MGYSLWGPKELDMTEQLLFGLPWCLRQKGIPIPIFLPKESHEQRSLAGYSVWGHKELDMTERLSTHILTPASSNIFIPFKLRVHSLSLFSYHDLIFSNLRKKYSMQFKWMMVRHWFSRSVMSNSL